MTRYYYKLRSSLRTLYIVRSRDGHQYRHGFAFYYEHDDNFNNIVCFNRFSAIAFKSHILAHCSSFIRDVTKLELCEYTDKTNFSKW